MIYLRKPEKLILRVEGRTPNDNPATFRIKFAGSFVPLAAATAGTEEPKLPEIKPNENSGVRVNSVGTIIEIKPKPTPQPKETTAKSETENAAEREETAKEEENKTSQEAKKEEEKSAEAVVTTEETPKANEKTPVKRRTPRRRAAPAPAPTRPTRTRTPANTGTVTPSKTEPPKTPAPNTLASVSLMVQCKVGTTLESPMSEVSRVNLDNKVILTIVLKDVKIERHSILNVAKMTIE